LIEIKTQQLVSMPQLFIVYACFFRKFSVRDRTACVSHINRQSSVWLAHPDLALVQAPYWRKRLNDCALPRSIGAHEHSQRLEVDRYLPDTPKVLDVNPLNHIGIVAEGLICLSWVAPFGTMRAAAVACFLARRSA
jgi:hypothetical protein